MTGPGEWPEFVEAHGKVIGYGDDEVFIPLLNDRGVRVMEESRRRFPWWAGGLRPIYGPAASSGEGS